MSEVDAGVVEKVLTGEVDAFAELVRKYSQRVTGLAYSQVKHWADAEDIAQDTFVQAYRNIGKLKDGSKFGPWVARITIGVSRDFLRERARKHIPMEDLAKHGEIDTPLEQAIKNETQLDKVITSVLTELPEDVQGIIALRFFERLAYREIAEYLDLPVSTVRGAIYRGTRYLRKRLKPYLVE